MNAPTLSIPLCRTQTPFCLRQHGTLRSSVFGFSARSAEKPNTNRNKAPRKSYHVSGLLPPDSWLLTSDPALAVELFGDISGDKDHSLGDVGGAVGQSLQG